jgi:glucose-6-phosphate dehydrogenase assembly protein OpcA
VLRAAPGQERPLAPAVLALLVPEVPVTAWMIGAPDLGSALFAEIAEAADRAFIDSSRAADIAATFRAALGAQSDHDVEMCDLAWCRLDTWRALIAQCFDHDNALRELARLQSIGSYPAGASVGGVVLVAGWLMSRLDCLSPTWCSATGAWKRRSTTQAGAFG